MRSGEAERQFVVRPSGSNWTVTCKQPDQVTLRFPSQQRAWDEAVRRARASRGVAIIQGSDGSEQRLSYRVDDLGARRRQALERIG